jgi:putative ABC transport system ATP-binding protein
MTSVINAADLERVFPANPPVTALANASLKVEPGERVAILGPSGAGKSTLLNLLGLLDYPTGGSYELAGRDVSMLKMRHQDRLRRELIGFIFQSYHVLPHRTVEENVLLKLAIAGTAVEARAALTASALDRVGMSHLCGALARNLSGGEKQRLAIARAIVNNPRLVLADEPTGNLDDANARNVFELLDQMADEGIAVVVISHDQRTTSWANRSGRLVRGILELA